jgi:hypothetical protein
MKKAVVAAQLFTKIALFGNHIISCQQLTWEIMNPVKPLSGVNTIDQVSIGHWVFSFVQRLLPTSVAARLLPTSVAATAVACGRMYHPHFLTFDET